MHVSEKEHIRGYVSLLMKQPQQQVFFEWRPCRSTRSLPQRAAQSAPLESPRCVPDRGTVSASTTDAGTAAAVRPDHGSCWATGGGGRAWWRRLAADRRTAAPRFSFALVAREAPVAAARPRDTPLNTKHMLHRIYVELNDIRSIRQIAPRIGYRGVLLLQRNGIAFPPLYFHKSTFLPLRNRISEHVTLTACSMSPLLLLVNSESDQLVRSIHALELNVPSPPEHASVRAAHGARCAAAALPAPAGRPLITGVAGARPVPQPDTPGASAAADGRLPRRAKPWAWGKQGMPACRVCYGGAPLDGTDRHAHAVLQQMYSLGATATINAAGAIRAGAMAIAHVEAPDSRPTAHMIDEASLGRIPPTPPTPSSAAGAQNSGYTESSSVGEFEIIDVRLFAGRTIGRLRGSGADASARGAPCAQPAAGAQPPLTLADWQQHFDANGCVTDECQLRRKIFYHVRRAAGSGAARAGR